MKQRYCNVCPPGFALPSKVLHDCTHCDAVFCTVHMLKHDEQVVFTLSTVPSALTAGRLN